MYSTLLTYFIFLFIVAVILLYIVLKLHIKNPVRFIGIIMAIIILPFFVGYFYFTYFNAIPETMVPDVIGLSKNEAVSRIENMGLKIKITEMDKEPKLVTNQRPEPGKIVKSGRIISVTIGSPVEISIPSPISVSEELNNEETGSND